MNGVFFRNFVEGGFYKVYVSLKSGNVGIGYMLEIDYEYKMLEVEIIEVPKVVVNVMNTTNIVDGSTVVNGANISTNTNSS